MQQSKVFVTRVIPEVGLNKILENCQADVWRDPLPPPRDVLLAKVADCDGLLALLTDRVDVELLDRAPKLRVVSNYAVGFNNIDVPAATSRGVAVGNTPGVLTDATADMAFALLISAARRIVESQRYTVDGKWKTWEPLGHIGQDLAGRTVGIVGMGRIGSAMARRCRLGWNMRVLYYDLHPNADAERELGAQRVELDALLSQSDFISVHTDLNDSTRGMFNAAAFAKMKPTAVFVNTARGPLVVERDLADALRGGQIFAAGLDVTDPEPPKMDNPLLGLSNCIVAPHIASATVSSRNAMAEIAADNLLAGLAGKPLRAWVNPEVARKSRG
ncbi:MAG TPA: D-glycerate dehydrogenase [Pirellulales bacterium]|jgi:glyoxylate reductase|nr:D-glycerate dehydrogenase [Pirellulales bacterium]